MSRDWTIGIVGVAVLAEILLGYALFGKPPYVFYSILKWTVAVATGLGAWALLARGRRYLPISVCLLLIGGVHLLGRMRRSQWVMFNWCAVAGLIVMAVILMIDLRPSRPALDA
jgi:hypothetical protein